jgi:hypothetical protein
LEAANVFVPIDVVGACAVPNQAAAGFALDGDLISHPSAMHFPQ